jgi:hypothetical protein
MIIISTYLRQQSNGADGDDDDALKTNYNACVGLKWILLHGHQWEKFRTQWFDKSTSIRMIALCVCILRIPSSCSSPPTMVVYAFLPFSEQ